MVSEEGVVPVRSPEVFEWMGGQRVPSREAVSQFRESRGE